MVVPLNLDEPARILVVAAHPDDEVLGCGGTLARAAKNGAKAAVMFLGEGIAGRFPLGDYSSPEFKKQSELRKDYARRACEVLNLEDLTSYQHLSCHFDTVPLIDFTQRIEAAIELFRPTILLTHNPAEVHLDHRVTFSAVEAACRPAGKFTPNQILLFEIVCSGNWTFENSFKPNVYVDISEVWDKKLEAWHCYESESRQFPFPRSDVGLETLARFRGMQAGLQLAEAFRLVRAVV